MVPSTQGCKHTCSGHAADGCACRQVTHEACKPTCSGHAAHSCAHRQVTHEDKSLTAGLLAAPWPAWKSFWKACSWSSCCAWQTFLAHCTPPSTHTRMTAVPPTGAPREESCGEERHLDAWQPQGEEEAREADRAHS